MPDLDLDAIEARANAATPGPWTTERPAPLTEGPAAGLRPGVCIAATSPSKENRVYANPPGGQYPSADQRFIAHARTDVPALADEVRRLRAALTSLSNDADHALSVLETVRRYTPDGPPLVAVDGAIAALRQALTGEGDESRG